MHLRKLAGLILVGILTLTIIFCSSGDNSTGPVSTRNINFENYDDLVKDILPDAYVTAQTSGANRAPFEIDPLWYEGEESILNKVLGEEHPQSVFYYLEQFDMTINDLEGLLQVDDSGNLYADTSWMRLYDLSSPTTVPTEAQPVIGATVDVEHWIDVEFEGEPEGKINHIGFTQNADEEIILLYNYWPPGQFSAEGESWIFYARYDKSDSSIVMKGMDFKDDGSGVSARNVFDVQTVNRSDFAYRMSWFSNEDPEMESLLGCIVGGGNKDTEFALRYRQFMPADAGAFDSTYLLEQVFNADYSGSASLITSYDDFIDEDLIFRYEDMPTQHLPSPWQD